MNKLIIYPLLIIFLCGAFNQLLVYGNIDFTTTNTLNIDSQTGTIINNGTSSTISTDSNSAIFNIDMITGLIALIIGLVSVSVIAGIRILDSGLSEHSVKLIYNATVYYGLWGVFSSLSFTLFLLIPIFGALIWLGLTLIYSLGFFETTWGN